MHGLYYTFLGVSRNRPLYASHGRLYFITSHKRESPALRIGRYTIMNCFRPAAARSDQLQ